MEWFEVEIVHHAMNAIVLFLAIGGRSLFAQDLAFTGDCGNSWYQTCVDGLCDNGSPKEKNNWAQQACLPNHPLFPNQGSLVIIPTDVILDGDASIMGLQVEGGGSLIMIQGKTLSLTARDVLNAGEIIINDTGLAGTFLTRLILGDQTQLSSTGVITLNSPDRGVLTATGLIINNPNHTIQGTGQITASFQNAGTVDANVPGSALAIPLITATNSGLFRASGGGILMLDRVSLNNAGGTLLATGGVIRLRATTVSGGTLNTDGTGVIETDGGVSGIARFSGITNQGLIHITAGVPAEVDGLPLVNHGTILINPTRSSQSSTFLSFPTAGTLRGTGTIVLNSPGLIGARLESGGTLIQEPQHTIRGEGRILAQLNNQGTVRGDVNGGLLELAASLKWNPGSIVAAGGGFIGVAGITIQNAGGRIAAENGTVQLYGAANILGGTLETSGTGVIESHGDPPNTLTDVTNRGQIHVVGFMALAGTGLVNDGTITIGDCPSFVTKYVRVSTSLTVSGSGAIILCGQEDRTSIWTAADVTLTHAAGHTIRGYGVVAGSVINNGMLQADVPSRYLVIDPSGYSISSSGSLRVFPDCNMVLNRAASFSQTAGGEIVVNGTLQVNHAALTLAGGTLSGTGTINGTVISTGAIVRPGSSAGQLTLNGDYTQGTGGSLEIEIGGTTPATGHDVLAVAGRAMPGGELRILPTGGFIAQPGQQFTVLTAGQVIGTFAAVTGPGEYNVAYTPTTVTLTVLEPPACGQIVTPDLDQDCDVDNSDVAAFRTCAAGPSIPLSPACRRVDFDGDNDGDMNDFGIAQRCYSGAGNPANPNCAN